MARVEFAYPYTDADGRQYQQDEVTEVDDGLAADLVASGFARRAVAPAPKPRPTTTDKEA